MLSFSPVLIRHSYLQADSALRVTSVKETYSRPFVLSFFAYSPTISLDRAHCIAVSFVTFSINWVMTTQSGQGHPRGSGICLDGGNLLESMYNI